LIKFYTNRELADKLSINLAKWKRWSREFLPPDALGGMQSGYTRQYSIDDAFKVFLGGHLVSAIKYTIPEAKKILHDLQEWLAGVGIYQNSGRDLEYNTEPVTAVKCYIIFIQPQLAVSGLPIGFFYSIRGIIAETTVQHKPILVRQQRYIETLIPPQKNEKGVSETAGVKVLNITAVLQQFVESLDIPKTIYDLLERE
jgi:hypothetical protein